ncbi:hypothetical protein ERD78_04235 [Allopusillimonas soli]|uniref:Uncharacterized protein n=1 Tax=Allopusillimonas soli TaxID=659016 RepID=A0A853FBZ7_9BURK|nr:hypothetical protein [Allopusillimonas soli]NYT36071.1 hypothetical protein [Allopusillimonas soli]TEA76409.1 hypothetical protein ERD78_04235 [Allopusillimonas soli]
MYYGSLRILCLYFLVGAAPAAAQLAGQQPAEAPARFQYDALDLVVPAGQLPDGPDSFERHYARALDEFSHTASLAQRRAEAAVKRETALRALRGADAGARILDMISGEAGSLLSQVNPVAGMVFDMAMGAVRKEREDGARKAEALAQQAEDNLRQAELNRPRLRRIAVWDRWLRVDDLDDASAVIYKPDVGEYLVLDTREKTWVRLAGAPEPDEIAASIADDPARCNYTPQRTVKQLPSKRIGGHDALGYREIEYLPGGTPDAAIAMEFVSYVSRQRIPDEILTLLNGMPSCPPDTPAGRVSAVPDAYVTLYQSMVVRRAGSLGKQTPPDTDMDGMLGFEQHLHILSETDRDALFMVPPSYRQLQ